MESVGSRYVVATLLLLIPLLIFFRGGQTLTAREIHIHNTVNPNRVGP